MNESHISNWCSPGASAPGAPKLYSELADWYHLLTRPEDYAEEAEFARTHLRGRTVLELGAGGGNNASHLKSHFDMTLTDLSEAMLANSRRINSECEHIAGDMRTLRLGRQFDAVFIHDAIMYMLTEADLKAALQTAYEHSRPEGVVLIMPDYVKETFRPGVHHGGHDGPLRSLRHFEWTFDPDSTDTMYTVDFVYMLREGAQPVRVIHDPHTCGLFSREVWLCQLSAVGFRNPRIESDLWQREVFAAVKPEITS
jgi:SAM-dependent methyltransferase